MKPTKSVLICIFLMKSCSALLPLSNFIPFRFLLTKEEQNLFIEQHTLQDPTIRQALDNIFARTRSTDLSFLLDVPSFHKLHSGRVHIVGYINGFENRLIKCMRRKRNRATIARIYDDFDSNIHRVVEAVRLQTSVELNHLSNILIPNKFLYHLPLRPTQYHDDNFLIVVDRLPILPADLNKQLLFSLSAEKHKTLLDQLFTLITTTGFEDAHTANIRAIVDGNGEVAGLSIIDTEPIALQRKKDLHREGNFLKLYRDSVLRGLYRFKKCLNKTTAAYWKEKVIAWRKHLPDDKKNETNLCVFTSKEEERAFIRAHLLPDSEVEKKLNTIYQSLKSQRPESIIKYPGFEIITDHRHIVGTIEEIPNYVLKIYNRCFFNHKHSDRQNNLYRIEQAKRFASYLERRGFTHIKIPEKFLYHVPGNPWKLSDEYFCVLAEKLTFEEKDAIGTINLAQWKNALMDLFLFIVEMEFTDTHSNNIRILKTEDGGPCFAIVDTEVLGLKYKRTRKEYNLSVKDERINEALAKFERNLEGEVKLFWQTLRSEWFDQNSARIFRSS